MRKFQWIGGLALALGLMAGAPALAMDGVGHGGGGSGSSAGGGWVHPIVGSAAAADGRILSEGVLDRLREGGGAALWAMVFGGSSRFEPSGATIDDDSQGALVGGELPLAGDWKLGLVAGVTREDVGSDPLIGSAKGDGWLVGGYGGGKLGPFDLALGVGQSQTDTSTRRSDGTTTFKADYSVRTTELFGELAWPLQRGGLSLTPYLRAGWQKVEGDDIAETGGTGAFSGPGLDFETSYSDVGLRVGFGDLGGFTPSLAVAWRHGSGDESPAMALTAAGSGGGGGHAAMPVLSPGSVKGAGGVSPGGGGGGSSGGSGTYGGAPLPGDSAVVRAGFAMPVGPARLSLDYDGDFSEDLTQQSVRLRFSYAF